MLGSIVFPLFVIYWPFFDPEKSTWCYVQGLNVAIPGGITLKISKELPGILAMPRAKFHADRWSPGGENRDWRKQEAQLLLGMANHTGP